MAKFHDFNISFTKDKKQLQKLIANAANAGYEIVAVNHVVADKRSLQNAPAPVELEDADIANLKAQGKRLQQLSRITLVLKDINTFPRMSNNTMIQSYDLLAVQPTTEKLFLLACTQLEVDIISIDFSQRLTFFMKYHPVRAALDRGIHFEINYAPAIRDTYTRRNIISNAHALATVSKGKNIIISSQADRIMELRSPYDVANLGLLFGLSENQSKDAVSRNCRALIMHSVSRRSVRSTLSVRRIEELEPKESWKVMANNPEEIVKLSKASDEETERPKKKRKR
ncbi:ribonuclease P protein subunit p30-like isoform X1 [Anneissia japonica]|uniref:ribonuclease P protein subunit p30-like isoform X1 n=1 Tax=Anneissia japonica TaxID=1529436 RepID=UPI0014258EE9|nr:ribonuclease P protein subunit p30-like isoform X1 [Anneissia japonica]